MVSVLGAVGVLFVAAVHTLITVVSTRFFRVRMKTQLGAALYALLVTPVALLFSTLVLTGVLGIGGELGSQGVAVLVVLVFPLVLGYSIDLFWLRSPEEIAAEMDLPDTTDRDRREPPRR